LNNYAIWSVWKVVFVFGSINDWQGLCLTNDKDHRSEVLEVNYLADCRGIRISSSSTRGSLRFFCIVPHRLWSHQVHYHSHHHPRHGHHEEPTGIISLTLPRAGEAILKALIVSTVTLAGPEKTQQSPHSHLMVEYTLAGIEPVRHICSYVSLSVVVY